MGTKPKEHTPEYKFNRVTTIRKSGGSSITTIPVEIMSLLELSIGDRVEYKLDFELDKVLIRKYRSEEQT